MAVSRDEQGGAMTAMYPEYAQWLRQVRSSMKLPKAVKLLFDQGRLYMSPVTEAHSEADDSIRLQLAEQLGGESGLHVTRDKGVLPERDGYTPEPDVLVVDAGALGPGDAFVDQKHVHFVAESVSRSTVGQDYGRKLNQYAARGIPTYLIVDVLTGECVLYQAPKGDEYTSAVPYRFGEEIDFSLAGAAVTVRTDFKKIR
ncbi:Uma2 family endonuclease [Streptomyces actuosus]|uniref:Uma2 family endonuclease n=2 Tax=Streptomyces actuosus TaxID=1885 RepID=A0ABS2VVD2_STRAS|nr:Uma2 family endonuclease [Streptomyces actuosus]